MVLLAEGFCRWIEGLDRTRALCFVDSFLWSSLTRLAGCRVQRVKHLSSLDDVDL